MARNANKMSSHFKEATGLRVVGMYVQEYFHWGWQQYDQQNDDGIDGEIIPRYRDGRDMGVRIFVQVKYGHSYYSSETNDAIHVQPYGGDGNRLKKHIVAWNRFQSPVLLVYVNADINRKDNNKSRLIDLRHPHAWWMRMDNYKYDGSTIVRIPKNHLFQEHSKGDLFNIIRPLLQTWSNYLSIQPNQTLLKLWYSGNVNAIAKAYYYQEWAESHPVVHVGTKQYSLIVSRVGWRHITLSRRKERIVISKKLLPIAKKVVEMSNQITPTLLQRTEDANIVTERIGLRARVFLDGNYQKIQVVLKHLLNTMTHEEKCWFYSVHQII